MIYLAPLLTIALDPPAKPRPPKAIPGECVQAYDIVAGEHVSNLLVENGVARCSATALPSSDIADLLIIEAKYNELWDLYKHDTVMLDRRAQAYEQAYKAVEHGWWKEPATQRTIGFILGASSVLLGAYAIEGVANGGS